MNFLIIVKLFESTGSTIATSFIWIAYALPAILVGPFAATWVDLIDKRLVLTIANLAQAVTILLYAIFANKYLFLSYVVVLVYSFFNQFYVPAEAATLPKVVNKKYLAHANSLFFLTQQASIIVGFSLAGVLAEILGYRVTFLASSGMLFLAFLAVSLLPGTKSKVEIAKKFEMGIMNFMDKTMEGYRFIRTNPNIWIPFLLLVIMHVSTSIATITLPAIAVDVIKINPKFSGVLIVLPIGLGALAGTILVTKFLKKMRKKDLIEKSFIVLGLSTLAAVFIIPEVYYYLKPILAAVIFFAIGASFVAIFVSGQTYLQEATPKNMMGRVFGNFWFLATIATIFPVLFSATITEIFGVRSLFFIFGIFILLIYVFSKYKGQELLESKYANE